MSTVADKIEKAAQVRQEVVSRVKAKFADHFVSNHEFRDETTVVLGRDAFPSVLEYLCKEEGFDYLVDLSTVDNSESDPRFEVVYELYSYDKAVNLRVKTTCPESDASVPTVTHLWAGANWHEREAWDMMGIAFTGHPDLRRILMWEGYPYFPLRKEFPLAGKPSDLPEVAFTSPAPLAGGPFVTTPCSGSTMKREPRSREQ